MDLQRTLLTEIILNMSSGGSFICDFFKKGESCLRNYRSRKYRFQRSCGFFRENHSDTIRTCLINVVGFAKQR